MILSGIGIVKGFIILVNRLASWFGSGYYFKKGYRQKQKRFILLGILISILMFWGLWFYLKHR